ncbi:MlaD family protein, partial [Acinetobacter geminorum]|uniref:MlaD family protein n=1 Tax=Acinetobacter geminorum TaxID=2730922 RepID=UPI003AF86548
MSENEITPDNSDRRDPDVELDSVNDLPEPQEKKSRWKPLLIWLIPLVALLIALSLAIKALLSHGPTIVVFFRTAEGLVAGKTTVRYKQVDIGVVRQIDLSEDRSH